MALEQAKHDNRFAVSKSGLVCIKPKTQRGRADGTNGEESNFRRYGAR